MRLRLLPFLIVAAAALFTVKIGNIWQGVSSATAAKADLVQLAAKTPEQDAGEAKQELGAAESEGAKRSSEAGDDAVLSAVAGKVKGAGGPDPFTLTDEEINLLQSLSKRRESIEQQARELEQREVLLKAAESRIDEKVAELEALRKSIEGLVEEHDEEADAQIKSLVKIYEAMKPKDAARIFEQLDMVVLLSVIERMKERKTAPILANMDPERAKTITLELAQRRSLPIAKN
jgi:flagellar motility protein MotE (MotC chaperone)